MPESDSAHFASQVDWEAWLAHHHDSSSGIWLLIAKKGSGATSVTHPQALESAICFGWIDAVRRAHDERFFLQRFTPRRSRSRWSQINRDAAERLARQGRMQPAGLAELERARADGRLDAAYAPMSRATVPDDLREELERNPAAAAFFATLDSQNRYAILHRLGEAKRPQTRARRLEKFIAMLNAHEKIHP